MVGVNQAELHLWDCLENNEGPRTFVERMTVCTLFCVVLKILFLGKQETHVICKGKNLLLI